jgi:transcriptional regulator with XRE-family HTH domain
METTHKQNALGTTVHEAREAKGLSTRGLAEIIGTTHSYIHKLEAGWFRTISPENIQALATALDLDPQDLFALAGYRVPDGLPSFGGYLRTKYGEDLTEEAIQRMTAYFEFECSRQGATDSQPSNRRDLNDGRRP